MFSRVESFVALFILGSLVASTSAFAPPHVTRQSQRCRNGLHMTGGSYNASPYCRQRSILFSTPSDDDNDASSDSITSATTEPAAVESPSPAAPMEPEGTQYPLNVPSPLLLASAMLLAIVCTGVFIL